MKVCVCGFTTLHESNISSKYVMHLELYCVKFYDMIVNAIKMLFLSLQVSKTFAGLSNETKALLNEVEKMLHILLVIPASNATAERSFSTLRRLKDWLRSSMLQKRSVQLYFYQLFHYSI